MKPLLRFLLLALVIAALAACQPTPAAPSEEPPATDLPSEPTQQPAEETPPPAGATSPPEATPQSDTGDLTSQSEDVVITSGGQDYPSYLSAPSSGGPYPAIVLIHSINGLEQGYKTLSDRFAARGYVVLALGWQTYARDPGDATMLQLVEDSLDYLTTRPDVDPNRLGLTGFCAGGRYTMLLLPQVKRFNAGVAWYGFPYRGSPSAGDLISELDAPMLVIHGTADSPSPIADVERYVGELQSAGKTVEFKYYDGEPHGFMLQNGQMRDDAISNDAFELMVDFFGRMLG